MQQKRTIDRRTFVSGAHGFRTAGSDYEHEAASYAINGTDEEGNAFWCTGKSPELAEML